MLVLVQWTTDPPSGWVEIDSAGWPSLPRRPEPVGGESIDGAPGWVYRLNVQGVELHGDHYAVEPLAGWLPRDRGCRVTVWSDDPDDYPPGERHARVWTFLPLAPDARLGGRYNTRQAQVVYAESTVAERMRAVGLDPLPWEEFVRPAAAATRHGIWVPPALNEAHDRARPMHGWREWTEGVPARLLDDRGRLRRGARE